MAYDGCLRSCNELLLQQATYMTAQAWRKSQGRLQKFWSMLTLASMTGAGTKKMPAWVR